MARLFDETQQEYLANIGFTIGYPFAMVCWYDKTAPDASHCLMSVADKDVIDQQHRLYSRSEANNYSLAANSYDGIERMAVTTSGGSSGYACGIWVANNDRRAFYNGANKGVNTDAVNIVGIDNIKIGTTADSTQIHWMSGLIAEAAIYDLSVWPGATDSDKADNFEKILPSLAKGFSPLFFPLGLVAYWPLIRETNI